MPPIGTFPIFTSEKSHSHENSADSFEREVYRDVLAPLTNNRIPRPWERAPVTAHAPRLQGQKIMKRPEIRSRRADDKENAAQHELESEGMGARKRLRRGIEENMTEPRWREKNPEEFVAGKGIGADEEKDEGADLHQYIPRKRTNMDRVITPRKQNLRQTTLISQIRTEVLLKTTESGAKKSPRRRKSMRKSVGTSITRMAKEFGGFDGLSPKDVSERVPEAGGEPQLDGPQNSAPEQSSVDGETNEKETHEAVTPITITKRIADALHCNDLQQPLNSLSDIELVSEVENVQDIPDPAAPSQEALDLTAIRNGNEKLDGQDTVASSPMFQQEDASSTLDILATHVAISLPCCCEEPSKSEQLEPKLIQKSTVEVAEAQSNDDQAPVRESLEPTHISSFKILEQALQYGEKLEESQSKTLVSEAAVLEPLETQSISISSPSPKSTESPRKKKATGIQVVRRGTRRSTRTTRASSVKLLDAEPDGNVDDPGVNSLASTGATEGSFTTTLSSSLEAEKESLESRDSPQEKINVSSSDEIIRSIETDGPASILSSGAFNAQAEQPSQSVENTAPLEIAASPWKRANEFTCNGPFITETGPSKAYVSPTKQHIPEDALLEGGELKPREENYVSSTKSTMSTEEPSLEIGEPELPLMDSKSFSNDELSDVSSELSSPIQFSPSSTDGLDLSVSEYQIIDSLEEPEAILDADETVTNIMFQLSEKSTGMSTPDPTPSDLVKTISENAPPLTYDHDDTDMLRNFLSRVKANKAAKASVISPKIKRSLPHSPLQIPLGETDENTLTLPSELDDEFDIGQHVTSTSSPSKRRRRNLAMAEEDDLAPKSIRRSGRTRLPVLKSPMTAPSFIPVRRLGQDGDTTVTLKRNEEKELATLTRINTRKNKAGALSAPDLLKKKVEEKDDPALRQRLLKEVFDGKKLRGTKKQRKNVAWATEIAQYQEFDKAKSVKKKAGNEKIKPTRGEKKVEFSAEKVAKEVKETDNEANDKKNSLRVRSKIALGMAPNGTPAPKRRTRDRQ